MKTAEQIIKEYLERGYSLESLRILAESREQPLGSRMLVIIESMEASAAGEESAMAEVHCETGTYSQVGEEMVFFVADDEPASAGEDGVDFDLMAATASAPQSPPAALEESVAEILVGDSSGAEMVSFKTEAVEDDETEVRKTGESAELGIWSRLWSRVSSASTPAALPSSEMDAQAPHTEMPVAEKQKDTSVAKHEARHPFFSNLAFESDRVVEPFEQEVVREEKAGQVRESFASGDCDAHSDTTSAMESSCMPAEEFIVAAQEESANSSVEKLFAGVPLPVLDETVEQAPVFMDEAVAMDAENALDAILDEEAVPFTTGGEDSAGSMKQAAVELGGVTSLVPASGAFLPALTESEMFVEGANSEISADYIPGSVSELYEAEDYAEMDRAASMIEEIEDAAVENEMPVAEAAGVHDENDAVPEDTVSESLYTDAGIVEEAPKAEELDTDLADSGTFVGETDIVTETEVASGEIAASDEPGQTKVEEEIGDVVNSADLNDMELEAALAGTISEEAASVTSPVLSQPTLPGSKKSTRKERRRRERAEKKKGKRTKKAAASELPEIVLTRSEDTETLMPEGGHEVREFGLVDAEAVSPETAEIAIAPSVPEMHEETLSENAEDELPPMGEAMNILTPADVVEAMGEGSDILAEQEGESAEASDQQDIAASAAVENIAADLPAVSEEMRGLVARRSFDALDALAGLAREQLFRTLESVAAAAQAVKEPAESVSEFLALGNGDDHLMIIANGGVDPEEVARLLSGSASDETGAAEGETEQIAEQNNIILFREKFPAFAGEIMDSDELEDEEEEEAYFQPVLHLLPPVEADGTALAEGEAGDIDAEVETMDAVSAVEEETSVPVVEEPAAELPAAVEAAAEPIRRADILSAEDRQNILLALAGDVRDDYYLDDDAVALSREHVIVGLEPETESPEVLLEREAALRSEMEVEYQSRLDAFASRLLDAQTVAAASEARVEEKKAELDARSAILAEMQGRLGAEEAKQRALLLEIEKAKGETLSKEEEIKRFQGIQEEHGRLYKEFEDLRKAYNEIVTDVMPGLQEERDELAMTIERQCNKERKLRSSLNSSRKRLAVGYTLAAAACLVLVALPVTNWLKSGEDNKQLAVDHQRMTQLQDTLDTQVRDNIEAQNRIVELERKVTMARDELAKLHSQNRELTNLAMGGQHAQGIAVFRPQESGVAGGTPTRASTMALQAAAQPGGALHMNEVMDPAGSIEQLAEVNRQRNANPLQPQMAQLRPGGEIPVSAVARTQPRSTRPAPQPMQEQVRGGGALRPQAGGPNAAGARSVATTRSVNQPRPDTMVAKVRKGEGVAQVVYRVLGSRDPDIIAWVIEENKIRSDRRGNPVIQPNQELRLPKDGRIGQAANAMQRGR